MAAKDLLSRPSSKGQGIGAAEYAEQGPYHCEDCVFLKRRDFPKEGKGLCNQKVMLTVAKVPTDKKSGLKIVNMEHGCCRYVKYPAGYVEEKEEEE